MEIVAKCLNFKIHNRSLVFTLTLVMIPELLPFYILKSTAFVASFCFVLVSCVKMFWSSTLRIIAFGLILGQLHMNILFILQQLFDLSIHVFPLLLVAYVTSIMYELVKETRTLTYWKTICLIFFFISSELYRKIPVG